MSLDITTITFDCEDAHRQAEFWAAVLGRKIVSDDLSDDAQLDGDPGILFQHVPETKQVKNPVRIDLAAGDFTAEVERLQQMGQPSSGRSPTTPGTG